jgi:GMP synthase (glutamine-hydrolysing)
MRRPVLVLTHASWETPALLDVALSEIPRVERTILNERSPELPPLAELGGVVVMGGPQDASNDDRYPGLRAERRLLAEAAEADVPIVGVCLGMQLLGLALGARLHLRHGREIGFAPVEWHEAASADPVLSALAHKPELRFLHWHSDAVELPRGAELLASTSLTPVQAFRFGSALGVQFHPEADAALLENWLTTPAMVEGLPTGEVARIRGDGKEHLPNLRPLALSAFGAFAAAVESRRNH